MESLIYSGVANSQWSRKYTLESQVNGSHYLNSWNCESKWESHKEYGSVLQNAKAKDRVPKTTKRVGRVNRATSEFSPPYEQLSDTSGNERALGYPWSGGLDRNGSTIRTLPTRSHLQHLRNKRIHVRVSLVSHI